MPETTKPLAGDEPAGGLNGGTGSVKNCLNPTTIPLKIQLIGSFDHDTMNAIIIPARERGVAL